MVGGRRWHVGRWRRMAVEGHRLVRRHRVKRRGGGRVGRRRVCGRRVRMVRRQSHRLWLWWSMLRVLGEGNVVVRRWRVAAGRVVAAGWRVGVGRMGQRHAFGGVAAVGGGVGVVLGGEELVVATGRGRRSDVGQQARDDLDRLLQGVGTA